MIRRPVFAFLLFAIAIMAGGSSRLFAEESHALLGSSAAAIRQEVWKVVMADLARAGLADARHLRPEDLDLPGALPPLAGRKFRVVSACWDDGPERTQFRVECAAPSECLPFLVYSRARAAGAVANAEPSAHVASCRLESSSPLRAAVAGEATSKAVVRPGDPARAVFLAAGLRMTASVTCLDRGREGEIIRVRAVDGHIFRARISGPGTLDALPQ